MSSMLVWGLCTGFLFKASLNKSLQLPLTYKPWKYLKSMLWGGLIFSYIDWSKRISLESLCKKEEISDDLKRLYLIDSMGSGEETYGQLKRQFLAIAVDEQLP